MRQVYHEYICCKGFFNVGLNPIVSRSFILYLLSFATHTCFCVILDKRKAIDEGEPSGAFASF